MELKRELIESIIEKNLHVYEEALYEDLMHTGFISKYTLENLASDIREEIEDYERS